MVSTTFSYHKAASVDEALSLLQAQPDAKIMAGGQSLLPAMKLRLTQPASIIYIGQMDELRYIRREGDMLHIGAGATHQDIASSGDVQTSMPLLAEAAQLIGDPAVRNLGTLGGSLAHADPAADWPASMIACKATIVLKGPSGTREIEADDFFLGIYMTALGPDELITEIKIPTNPAGGGTLKTAYSKFMQPASRFAIVGCAVVLRMEGDQCTYASVGFTGVADTAYRGSSIESALIGQNLSEAVIEAACSHAAEGVDVLGDHFASENFRKHLASVYAKRAIKAALA